MQPFRLRVLLIAVLLSVQLVTVVTLIVSMQRDATTALQSAAASTLGRFADRVDERMRHHLDAAESALSVGERLMHAGVIDAGDDEALTRYFTAELQSHRWLYGMALGREDGSFTHVGRVAGGLRSTVAELAEGGRRAFVHTVQADGREPVRTWRTRGERFDPRERPWYHQAREGEGIVWSDPYPFHGTEVPGVSASLALELPASGGGAGVLAVGIDLRVLSSLVSTAPWAGHGSAVLIDAGRQVVAYSDASRLDGAIVDGRMPALSSLDDRPLEYLLRRLGARGVPASEAPARAEVVTVDERRHLALVRPFDTMPSFRHVDSPDTSGHWMLVAQVPFERYAAGIDERFAHRLSVIVAMLTLSALLAIAAVIRFTRPVYRIHRDATLDGLTGACNRAEFERRANALAVGLRSGFGGGLGGGSLRELMRGRRRRQPSSVLATFDLDGFKGINDAVGHAAGDAVLRAFVERLGRHLRPGEVVGRLGGDEFAVALAVDPASGGADDAGRVEALRRAVVSEPVTFEGRPLRFGATAGFARRREDESVSRTLERADRALVAGKAIAKDRSYPAGEDGRRYASGIVGDETGGGGTPDAGAIAPGGLPLGAALG